MRNSRIAPAGALAALCALAIGAGSAEAGEFEVGNCQADRLNFSTRAFADFATRGMRIKRACDPEGPGLRGLVTSNAIRRGRVRRGARALVTLSAPAGTRFTRFRWAGAARRRDCRYALQLYADGPDIRAVPIKNVRANRRCPREDRAQAAGYRSRSYNIAGATRIVQRVICVGSRRRGSCSARGFNYIRTFKASVRIADVSGPSVGIAANTPLARGTWVRGSQALEYSAVDNVGVRIARAVVAGQPRAEDLRSCVYADRGGTFADRIPCANGPGQITVKTQELSEGTQPLVVQAQDTAGNVGASQPLTARIDNTPPARVAVGVAGGEGWTNRNSFALGWSNPHEPDRAPIAAARYALCRVGGSCEPQGRRTDPGIRGFALSVPAPGQWALRLWVEDSAANQEQDNASDPVLLRFDPEPPRLSFEPVPATDPTRVSVLVDDRISGLGGGQVEIGRQGSSIWQAVPTQSLGTRLVGRIDDARLPPGTYLLRARAHDQARNEGSTDRLLDGRPMVVTLPLRIASSMRAGIVRKKTVRRKVSRRGKRRRVRRRVTVLKPAARVRFGRRIRIAGRLSNRDGQGIAGGTVYVYSRTRTSPERLVGVVQSDGQGRYRYTATGNSSRTLRFVYAGTALILPAQGEVRLVVPAATSIRVSRRAVLNGQSVRFRGRLRTQPVPAGGKLVELQVKLSSGWQTFRTLRSDAAGRWALRYRFRRSRGVQRFRFRARLPREVGYAFDPGRSRSIKIRVRGR